MALVKVATVEEIDPGTGSVVTADGKEIALFNLGGTYYAIDNTCKHLGGPLGEGDLEAEIVTCPWHGWEYNVKTGGCQMDATICVETYPVQVQGTDVMVEV